MHENQKGTRGLTNSSVFILTFVNYIRELSRTTKRNDADTQQYIDNGMFSL